MTTLHADKGYGYPLPGLPAPPGHHRPHRPRGVNSSTRLGRIRWVVERTVSWLLRFERLGLRYDRTYRTVQPLLTLAVTLINLRRLAQAWEPDIAALTTGTPSCSGPGLG